MSCQQLANGHLKNHNFRYINLSFSIPNDAFQRSLGGYFYEEFDTLCPDNIKNRLVGERSFVPLPAVGYIIIKALQ